MADNHPLLNLAYKNPQTLLQIKQAFSQNRDLPSVTLQKIFDEGKYRALAQDAKKPSFRQKTGKMHSSFGAAPIPASLKEALSSKEFLGFCATIFGCAITSVSGSLHRFAWKDYTLLHDEGMEKEGLDVIIDFTDSWEGNAGGKIVYVDGTGNYHHIPSSPNTLTLASRKEGVLKFVQYVNHKAGKKSRVLFLGTFRR